MAATHNEIGISFDHDDAIEPQAIMGALDEKHMAIGDENASARGLAEEVILTKTVSETSTQHSSVAPVVLTLDEKFVVRNETFEEKDHELELEDVMDLFQKDSPAEIANDLEENVDDRSSPVPIATASSAGSGRSTLRKFMPNFQISSKRDSDVADSKDDNQENSTSASMSCVESISELPETKAELEAGVQNFSMEDKFEFRSVNVTVELKALAGVSQTKSGKGNSTQKSFFDDDRFGNDGDDTVTAVVTYKRNTIASDKFVSTNVPSLPLLLENVSDKKKHAQVYAKWPSAVEKDDDDSCSVSTASTGVSQLNPSCITLTHTVRGVTYFDGQNKKEESDHVASKIPTEKKAETNDKSRNEHKSFLSSISKAFAPALVDFQVGLMRGSKEIIPLGVASVLVPGEYQTLELDIPVVKDYTGEAFDGKKKTKLFSSLGGKANMPSKDFVSFSADKSIKYRITEGAFLRLVLKIDPIAPETSSPSATQNMNANSRKTDFRAGPINKAIRKRRKIEDLMARDKLSLHQRIQLYFELRNSSPDAYDLPEPPINERKNDEETCHANNAKEENSHVYLKSQCDASTISVDSRENGHGDLTCGSQPNAVSLSPSTVTFGVDTTFASEGFTSVSPDGRISPVSQGSDRSGVFSSSLYSVFSTNHPQKKSASNMFQKLLSCDPTLFLCDNEVETLMYYVNELSDEILGPCKPIKRTRRRRVVRNKSFTVDDGTQVSFESLSLQSAGSCSR